MKKDKIISIRLTEQELYNLQKISEIYNISVGSIIRHCIDEFLKRFQ